MNSDLHAQARTGDESALAELLRQHDPWIRREIENAIPARWRALLTADDVLQQTWLDAFLSIASVSADNDAAFATWLRRVAGNNLSDAIRALEAERRGGGVRPVEPVSGSTSGSLVEAVFGYDTHTPSREMRDKELEAALRLALQALPLEYRQAAELHDVERRPISEIASLLGRSEGAVHMLRLRAHAQLREILASNGILPPDFQ